MVIVRDLGLTYKGIYTYIYTFMYMIVVYTFICTVEIYYNNHL